MAKTNKEICAELVKNGAKRVPTSVNRASAQVLATWTRVRLELKDKVVAYIKQDDETYKLGEDNIAFVSLFNLLNGLRDTEFDTLMDHIKKVPTTVPFLFKDAKVTLVAQMLKEGDVDSTGEPVDHDTIYWHVESVELDGSGKQWATRTIMGLLGIPVVG